MPKYHYKFHTQISFARPVYSHLFLLRCTPCKCEFQQILSSHVDVEGATWLAHGSDAFGNTLIYGAVMDFHATFSFVSEGDISDAPYLLHDVMRPFYGFPSPLTIPSVAMTTFARETDKSHLCKFPLQRALALSDALHAQFGYAPGTTRNCTTAAEAFAQGHGVCQDFAHILITLCREVGIPARYVNGFVRGEGVSHAWTEVYDSGTWYGIDPTHNTLIESGHIKIAHGRDANDCPIDRGVYLGMKGETADIKICVTPQ